MAKAGRNSQVKVHSRYLFFSNLNFRNLLRKRGRDLKRQKPREVAVGPMNRARGIVTLWVSGL